MMMSVSASVKTGAGTKPVITPASHWHLLHLYCFINPDQLKQIQEVHQVIDKVLRYKHKSLVNIQLHVFVYVLRVGSVLLSRGNVANVH